MRDIDVSSVHERNEPVRLSAALGMGDLAFTAQTFGGGGNGAGAAVTLADAAISAGYARDASSRSARLPKASSPGTAVGASRRSAGGAIHGALRDSTPRRSTRCRRSDSCSTTA